MSVTYDTLTNSTDTIQYTLNATNTYMDSNFVSTFGPIWLPRIYGKDLTAFEIASSGKIALTVNDVHSIDITRADFGSNKYIHTISSYSNTSLQLQANTNDLSFVLDANSNNALLNAASNIEINARNGNLKQTASNNFILTAKSNFQLNTCASNITLVFDEVSRDATLYTASNFIINNSNSTNVNSSSNITLHTTDGEILIAASNNNIHSYASNNYVILASNNYVLDVNTDITQKSYNAAIITQSLTSNIESYAFQDYKISASNELYLGSVSNITIETTDGEIFLRSLTSNVVIYGSNNIIANASNNINIHATSNITILSHHGDINITNAKSNINILTSNSMFTYTSNLYFVQSRSNMTLNTSNGEMFINSLTNNISLFSSNLFNINTSNNLNIKANSNINIDALTGSYTLKSYSNIFINADSSNVYLHMNVPQDTMSLYALSNIDINTSNALLVSSRSNIAFTTSNFNVYSHDKMNMSACNLVNISTLDTMNITACNSLNLVTSNFNFTTNNDMSFTSRSNINFFISSAPNTPSDPIFKISGSNVQIRGDIELTGTLNTTTINSTTVTQSTLKVEDKQIVLARGTTADSLAANTAAGLIIDGYPSGDSNAYSFSNKSILWNYGTNGQVDMGTADGINTESFWEVQGGAFRLTHRKAGGSNISFTFRVNEYDELELVKRFMVNGAFVNKKIARFGRVF